MAELKIVHSSEVDAPHSEIVRFPLDRALAMDAGVSIPGVTIAYQTEGVLNAANSNASPLGPT